LTEHFEKLNSEQAERTRSLQSETRQRDEAIRAEILNLSSSLELQKVSRQDLSMMLTEWGLRLRNETETP